MVIILTLVSVSIEGIVGPNVKNFCQRNFLRFGVCLKRAKWIICSLDRWIEETYTFCENIVMLGSHVA